jgi:hypothetical protein
MVNEYLRQEGYLTVKTPIVTAKGGPMGTFFFYFLPACFGSEEYHEAWHKRARTWSFPMRFWGRLIIAALGLCFFLWQQITEPAQWWGSDTFATVVLCITTLQAAGPLFYLLFKFTLKFFLTKHYCEALEAGNVYFTLKSALCILLTTIFSVLAAYGFLGTRWYVKLFAFFLTFPVAWFLVIFPVLNWAGVRWVGFPKAILTVRNPHLGQSSDNG